MMTWLFAEYMAVLVTTTSAEAVLLAMSGDKLLTTVLAAAVIAAVLLAVIITKAVTTRKIINKIDFMSDALGSGESRQGRLLQRHRPRAARNGGHLELEASRAHIN